LHRVKRADDAGTPAAIRRNPRISAEKPGVRHCLRVVIERAVRRDPLNGRLKITILVKCHRCALTTSVMARLTL
jgi:hypothetical protein